MVRRMLLQVRHLELARLVPAALVVVVVLLGYQAAQAVATVIGPPILGARDQLQRRIQTERAIPLSFKVRLPTLLIEDDGILNVAFDLRRSC